MEIKDLLKQAKTYEEIVRLRNILVDKILLGGRISESTIIEMNFLDLLDTPNDYAGQAGKYPKVNAGEDALEFTDLKTVVPVTLVVAANNSLDTDRADYVVPAGSTSAETTINTAISALPAGGGSVVLLEGLYTIDGSISLPSNVELRGCGKGTEIKIKDNLDVDCKMIVNSNQTVGNEHLSISNLKINGNLVNQAAGTQYGIWFQRGKYCNIHHNYITGCVYGVQTSATGMTDAVILSRNLIKENTIGVYVTGQAQVKDWIVANNLFEGNTNTALIVRKIEKSVFKGNVARNNYKGFYFYLATRYCSIVGNVATDNSTQGFQFGATADFNSYHNVIVGNVAYNNNTVQGASVAGFEIGDKVKHCSFQSNIARKGNFQRYGISVLSGADNNLVANNDLYESGTISNFSDSGGLTESYNNRGTTPVDEKRYVRVKNTSGGQLVLGNVVIFKSAAAGDEVTTTANQGNDKVYGMVTTQHNDNAYQKVQILGKTTALKVNGTTNINIGDFLGTYTAVGISMKTSAGDMAYAIALEGYATNDSNGVIDALLIVPRKV